MTLTVQEKLSLMMTSAGSQRALAALIGVSHQKVGRWLRGAVVNPRTGEITNEPHDAATIAALNQAFSMHRDVSRQQARVDKLPFDPAIPIYIERKPFEDGRPGERAVAEHTHWISNDLRERVFISAGKSGKYLNVSVRSTIDLRRYNERANTFAKSDAAEGVFRTKQQNAWRAAIRERLDDAKQLGESIVQQPIYTSKQDFFRFALKRGEVTNICPVSGEVVSGLIDEKLRQKHEPAVGEKGTQLADQFLFQTIPDWVNEIKPHAKKTARVNRKAHPKARAKAKKR